LLIESVQAKHAGRYDCTDDNGYSENEFASAQLFVVRPDLTPHCDVIELTSFNTSCSEYVLNCQLQFAGFFDMDSPLIVTWTDRDGAVLDGGINDISGWSTDGTWFNKIVSNIHVNCSHKTEKTPTFVTYTIHFTSDRQYDDYDDEPRRHHVYSANLTANVTVRRLHQVNVVEYSTLGPFLHTIVSIVVSGFAVFVIYILLVALFRFSSPAKRHRIQSMDFTRFQTSRTSSRQTTTSMSNSRLSAVTADVHTYEEIADVVIDVGNGNYSTLKYAASPSTVLSEMSSEIPATAQLYEKLNVESGGGGEIPPEQWTRLLP
jgi:hypothetical protein